MCRVASPQKSDCARTALRSPIDRTRQSRQRGRIAATSVGKYPNREVAATRPGDAQGPVLSIGDRYESLARFTFRTYTGQTGVQAAKGRR